MRINSISTQNTQAYFANNSNNQQESFCKELAKGALIWAGVGFMVPVIRIIDGDSLKEVKPPKGLKSLGAYAGTTALAYTAYKTGDYFIKSDDKKKEKTAKTIFKSALGMSIAPLLIKISCWENNEKFFEALKTQKSKAILMAGMVIGACMPLFRPLFKKDKSK